MAGEFDFIDWIRQQQRPDALVRVPIGDDLAALNWPAGELLLVGVDQMLDGVHFDANIHSPTDIGRKVMNRNLSDCAAMGCLPAAAVATVALPKNRGLDYAKRLFLGLSDAGQRFDCQVVGGDTGAWDGKLVMTVTILGRSAGVSPITRDGAQPGDAIYVTGPLGGSILGRHLTFEPRVALGRELAGTGLITAMIDLSDGLSRDLGHICKESGVGAVIDAAAVPVHDDVHGLVPDGQSALEHALNDGEDYELLFTSPDFALERLGKGVKRVGRVSDDKEIWLDVYGKRVRLGPGGWEHQI